MLLLATACGEVDLNLAFEYKHAGCSTGPSFGQRCKSLEAVKIASNNNDDNDANTNDDDVTSNDSNAKNGKDEKGVL